jgi:hypothetical protein
VTGISVKGRERERERERETETDSERERERERERDHTSACDPSVLVHVTFAQQGNGSCHIGCRFRICVCVAQTGNVGVLKLRATL